MKRELTDVFLRAIKPPAPGQRLELRDAREPCLVLRMTAAGAATWSVRTRTRDGKQTRPKIGTWPAMGIGDARKQAKATLAAIQGGADVVEAKREAQAARKARKEAPTVATRLEEWRAAKANDRERPWSERHAAEVARIINRELVPALGKRILRETTRQDWTTLVAAKRRKAPAMAALLYRVVSSFLGFAEASGWISEPLLPRKGATMLAAAVASRERTPTDDEIVAIWKATEGLRPKSRAFVRLLILTAARREEVAGLAAGEVDRSEQRWRLPPDRAKNGKGMLFPLSSLALQELSAVWPNEDVRPSYRLLGAIKGQGFSGFSKVKAQLDAAIAETRDKEDQIPAWRFHDLRRSARTAMTRLGVQRDHAEAALGHVSHLSQLERVYDRHDYEAEALAALAEWQTHVERLVSAS